MPDAIDELLVKWRAQDVKLNAGATSDQLDRFESDLSVKLPADFRKLYGLCDGMEPTAWTTASSSLWSLDRIRKEEGVRTHRSFDGVYIFFADAVISAPDFALGIRRSGETRVVALWGELEALWSRDFVADSITGFAAKHLALKLPGIPYD